MHVVHLSKVTGIAGSETHLLMLLPGLAGQGIDVTMIMLEDPTRRADDFYEAMAARGVTVERVAIGSHIDLTLTRRLVKTLNRLKPDILHTHLIHADLYGMAAARRAEVRGTISSRHNDNPFRRNPAIRLANQRAMGRADRVITISEALNRFVREVEGIAPEKVITVHYGLNPPDFPANAREEGRRWFEYSGDRPVIGMFGRLIEQKGVDTLLNAFVQVRQAVPDAVLLIVGDGDQRSEMQALAESLGISEAVTFAGWVPQAYKLMPACDAIAMPSRWEGFGLVALEAMGSSRPLIASRVSALPEIVVDGETGLLVPPDDPAALAKAITPVLSDRPLALRLGEAGYRRLVEQFSVDKMIRGTLSVYEDIIQL
ncbi:MAG: glycosyltransferase family 4 protein [Anaerolineae bacterium]|nr:glycosyltransferase family 4 protein [Anaerolineae bacterium]